VREGLRPSKTPVLWLIGGNRESIREAKPPSHTLPLSFEGEGDKGGEVRNKGVDNV